MYSYIAISIINFFSFLLFVLSFVSGQSTIRSKNEKTSSSKRKMLRRVRERREKKEEHLTYFCCFISRAKRSGLLPPPLNFVSVYCSLVEKITQFNAIIGVLLRLKCFFIREKCLPRTTLTARCCCCCLYHYYSQERTRAFADEWW